MGNDNSARTLKASYHMLFGTQEMFDFINRNIGNLSSEKNQKIFMYILYHDVALLGRHYKIADSLYTKIMLDFCNQETNAAENIGNLLCISRDSDYLQKHLVQMWEKQKSEVSVEPDKHLNEELKQKLAKKEKRLAEKSEIDFWIALDKNNRDFEEFSELANEVWGKVNRKLITFLKSERSQKEVNRNAWLKIVCLHAKYDLYRTWEKWEKTAQESLEALAEEYGMAFTEEQAANSGTGNNLDEIIDKKEEIIYCMKKLCERPQLRLDKVIVCIFAASFLRINVNRQKVDVAFIAEQCNNKTCEEAVYTLLRYLKSAFSDANFDVNDFKVLFERVTNDDNKDVYIDLKNKQITDAINKNQKTVPEITDTGKEKSTASVQRMKKQLSQDEIIQQKVNWLVEYEKILFEEKTVRRALEKAILKAYKELPLNEVKVVEADSIILEDFKAISIGEAFDKLVAYVEELIGFGVPKNFYYRFETRIMQKDYTEDEFIYKLVFITE